MSYRKKTLLLIGLATLTRLIIAGSVELGNDEVYYRMYAQYLQWNYFDHPPIAGWLIRLTTLNGLLDTGIFIRLGAIISAAAATWLMFLCGKKLLSEYAGFLAAFIYTATIYGSIIAGTFMLPDSPQMVCWSGALYLLLQISENRTISRSKKSAVIWFGVVAGLGMLCKIHTIFLWAGFGCYVIIYNRNWLKQPVLYIAALITCLLFTPVIKWNIDNHFVTYTYHSNRIDVADGGFSFSSFLTFLGGQFLYFNPVIYLVLVTTTFAALRNKIPVTTSQKRLLLLCSLPLIVTATFISFFKQVLPHWTGPAYTGLILLSACYFADKKPGVIIKRRIPLPIEMATGLIISMVTAGLIIVNYFPGTIGSKKIDSLGEGDFTLDMYGWNNLKPAFEKIAAADVRSGLMKKDAVIICNKWFPAAHIDFYVAMPLNRTLIAIGDTSDIHQYAWINEKRKSLRRGDDAYCIVPSDDREDVTNNFGKLFTIIQQPIIIEQTRNGKACRRFYIYRLKNYLADSYGR